MQAEIDKLDVGKLIAAPSDWNKLSNAGNNDVVKKNQCNKLNTKVNNIDTSLFVLKNKYITDKSELENKISHAD